MKGQQAAVGVEPKDGAKEGDGGRLGQLVVVNMVREPTGSGGLVPRRA